MRASRTATLLALAFILLPVAARSELSPSCLVTLNATAANSTSSNAGTMLTGTAGNDGTCGFTVTACVNDTTVANCSPGPVNRMRLVASGNVNVSGLQDDLQSQLPSQERLCKQTTVKVGQTLHRRIQAAVRTADGRSALDSVILNCQCAGAATKFSSTFEGIQKVVFEQGGCTNQACHSTATKQGGLDLTAGASYQNLVGVAATESEFHRVEPGDQNRSFLWLKLAAKTNAASLPVGVEVAGAPMPNNLGAISQNALDAVRLWIFSGAPQTGTVGGTETLLNACLAPPEPIVIKPLDAPAPGTGVQFVMPPWKLEAHSEHEICFATYYDISAQVPGPFQDQSFTMFRFSAQELRQDPQSHHLILNRYAGPVSKIHDPSLGAWTCNGGPHPGATCEPTDVTSCGTGTCMSEIKQSFACLGFGPPSNNGQPSFYAIGGAQKAQFSDTYLTGVFAQIPMKGILYWNSHAFNLTDQDTVMHARLNYYFAQSQQFPVQGIFDISRIFAPSAAPFTTQTICNNNVLPQGARLFSLSSHTHKHGKHFTVTAPDGTPLYDSFVYNDPATVSFNPPLVFDSSNAAERTLKYCSLYNNGVAADGVSKDVDTVTRYSRLPQSARNSIGVCTPVACVSGNVGARCRGVGDDRSCDSAPGANDGSCDACPITGGESTENEMFILIGNYYFDTSPAARAAHLGGAAAAVDDSGRSLVTDVVLPPQIGCSSSPGGHAAHHAAVHSEHP